MNSPADGRVIYFARTTFRNEGRAFGIKQADRFSHMYIIGKTGTGKSTLLETLVRQDIHAGRGLALIDPHGDLVERVAATTPERRRADLLYFNVPDPAQPFGYNPLKRVRPDKIPLAASGLLEVFKKMRRDAWGVRMEHILRNALLALLEQPDAALPDILRLLLEKAYRTELARRLVNPQRSAPSGLRSTGGTPGSCAPTASRRSRTRSTPSSPTRTSTGSSPGLSSG